MTVNLSHLIGGVQREGLAPVRGLGDYVASEIRPFQIEAFKDRLAPLITGKAYSVMQRHYSTVNGEEQRASLVRVSKFLVIEGGLSQQVAREVASDGAEVASGARERA